MRVSDAPPSNWVDRHAPDFAKPYLRLMRADRPIGTWLLLWPCWWSAALAWKAAGTRIPDLWLLLLFAIGATVMRGAGCVYNDIADRDFDAQVARTRSRPIPSGQVSITQAAIFMVALCLIGLAVLLQFNRFAIILGMASLGIVALYPFMKRITYWPQTVLGLAFSWGALMGWAEVFGRLDAPALLLYAASIAWTVGYDTIYAHQDKEDDALVGLKSTALKFGPSDEALAVAVLWRGACPAPGRRRTGRRRMAVFPWHGACFSASRLAGDDARHRRCGELPAAVPRQSGFRRHCVSRAARRYGNWRLRITAFGKRSMEAN